MPQDFSKKITIVLKDNVASWQLANTVGHIAAYLGNKMSESFDTGKYFISKDEKLADVLKTKFFKDLSILGIGIFGPNEKLKVLTNDLKLWK